MMALDEVGILVRQHPIGRAQQHGQPRIDQIDLRQRDRQVAAQHDAFVQDVIDDVQQRRLAGIENGFSVASSTRHGGVSVDQ